MAEKVNSWFYPHKTTSTFGRDHVVSSRSFVVSFVFMLVTFGLLNVQNWSRVIPGSTLPAVVGNWPGNAIASLVLFVLALVSLFFWTNWWVSRDKYVAAGLIVPELFLLSSFAAFEGGTTNPAGTTKYLWAPLYSDTNSTTTNTLADTTWAYNNLMQWPYLIPVAVFFGITLFLWAVLLGMYWSEKPSADGDMSKRYLYWHSAVLMGFLLTLLFIGQPNLSQCANTALYTPVWQAMCAGDVFIALAFAAWYVGFAAIEGVQGSVLSVGPVWLCGRIVGEDV